MAACCLKTGSQVIYETSPSPSSSNFFALALIFETFLSLCGKKLAPFHPPLPCVPSRQWISAFYSVFSLRLSFDLFMFKWDEIIYPFYIVRECTRAKSEQGLQAGPGTAHNSVRLLIFTFYIRLRSLRYASTPSFQWEWINLNSFSLLFFAFLRELLKKGANWVILPLFPSLFGCLNILN